MAPSPARRRRSRRWLAGTALILVAAIAATVLRLRPGTQPAPEPPATAQPSPAEPSPADPYRPAVHLTPGANWINDPQRPVFIDGRWHLYYLYNADHPHGNGTAWYHVTSTDLVHWQDEGVAIEKYRNGLGDIWTGSVVVDTHGTAGFGDGAVIALVTQQADGVQRQSMFVSTDGGYHFASAEGNPVMDNPGQDAWRDPKVSWDDTTGQWLMLLAEGNKIGFYTSPNLRSWTYRSGFVRDDLGVLECPELFPMPVDGDPGRTTWVLGLSGNDTARGGTTGYAYWTGSWDGSTFTPEHSDPLWLDHGSDFYAAVSWPVPDAPAERYAIGWLNNWAYAGDLPTTDWSGGALSSIRTLRLDDRDGRPTLTSRAAVAPDAPAPDAAPADLTVGAGDAAVLGASGATAERLRLQLDAGTASAVHLTVRDALTLTFHPAARTLTVSRSGRAPLPEEFTVPRSVQLAGDGPVDLDVIVDASSVEVFAGGASLSSLFFPDPGASGLTVSAEGGVAEVSAVTLTALPDSTMSR